MPRTIEPQRRPPHGPVPTPVRLAHVSESLGARLNGFANRSFADLVADAGGLQILNDGLLPGFLF